MKKALAFLLAAMMLVACVGCNTNEGTEPTPAPGTTEPATTPETTPEAQNTEAPAAAGSVYYLNFKPEQDQQWQDLAKLYTETTGVPVTVVTAAQGTYEQTLMSEMAKEEAPTLF